MYNIGDRLELKKTEKLIEIIEFYPGGQGTQKTSQYKIILNGHALLLEEYVISELFDKIDKQEFLIVKPSDDTSRSAHEEPQMVVSGGGQEATHEVQEEHHEDSDESHPHKKRGRPKKNHHEESENTNHVHEEHAEEVIKGASSNG